MKLYRTRTPEAVTVSIQFGEHSATLSGRPLEERAIIEGLLWWTIGRMIEDFTVGILEDALPKGMLIEVDEEINTGERLVRYVATTPWKATTNKELISVVKTLRANLSRILPKNEQFHGDRVQRLQAIETIIDILRDRIDNFNDLDHGVVIEDQELQPS